MFASALTFACGAAFAAVDLNTASQQELESVKGIGPAKAKAILDYRTKNGPFKAVDDLAKVPGFGAKSVSNEGRTGRGRRQTCCCPGRRQACRTCCACRQTRCAGSAGRCRPNRRKSRNRC